MPEITGAVNRHWHNTLFITDEMLGSEATHQDADTFADPMRHQKNLPQIRSRQRKTIPKHPLY